MKAVNKRMIAAMVGMAVLLAWTSKQGDDMAKAEWLIGTWENATPRGSIYETWHRTSGHVFSGKSYIVQDNDTIVFEVIQLVQDQDGLYYIPVVKDQNDGMPVRFASTRIDEGQMVFENLQHDFPQIICYTKITTDSLVAEISGTINGQQRKQHFPMKRIK